MKRASPVASAAPASSICGKIQIPKIKSQLKNVFAKIEIIPTKNSSSTEISDDESYDVLTKMQQDIDQLQINKMDKYFEYNEEDSTIQFFSNGAPYGSPIKIDDEISWKNWS